MFLHIFIGKLSHQSQNFLLSRQALQRIVSMIQLKFKCMTLLACFTISLEFVKLKKKMSMVSTVGTRVTPGLLGRFGVSL